jgi:hypothetical protein
MKPLQLRATQGRNDGWIAGLMGHPREIDRETSSATSPDQSLELDNNDNEVCVPR